MRSALLLATSLLLTACGCVREAAIAVDTGRETPAPAAEPLVETQLTVFTDEAPAAAPPSLSDATAAFAIVPDPVRFKIGAGYGALARVDLGNCRDRGLRAGYLRVRATFTPVGYVARASIASVTPPPPSALDCIADQLRQMGVPAFEGHDAKLSKTYFVEPGAE